MTLSLFIFSDLSAQYSVDIAGDTPLLHLREKYPDQSFVMQNAEHTYQFSLSENPENPVVATETVEEVVTALKDFESFEKVIFYDENSAIHSLEVRNVRDKRVRIKPVYTNYQTEGIFHDDAKVCYFEEQLGESSDLLKVSFQKKYEDVRYLTRVFFHENTPVLEKKLTFDIPAGLEVELLEINFEGFDFQKEEKNIQGGKQIIYTARNLDHFRNENGSAAYGKTYPHLLVICKTYTDGATNKPFLATTDDLYNWYASLCKEVNNDEVALKAKVDELLKDQQTDEEKIKSIYYWVQDNIRYIAFEEGIMGFRPQTAQHVYEKRYGDCKGMANLAKTMLGIAGFDARLTWLGTRDIPYDYTIPSLAVDNHMICTLILDGKRYFLDPTEKYIGFDNYAHRIQGRPVMIEDGEQYMLDKVPDLDYNNNKVQQKTTLHLNNSLLSGENHISYRGEQKTVLLRRYHGISSNNKDEALQAYLTGGERNIGVSEIHHQGFDDRDQPLEINYHFTWQNNVQAIGNEMYLALDWDKEFDGFTLEEDRLSIFELPYKVNIQSEMQLHLPAAYKVSYLPEPVSVDHPYFKFQLAYQKQQGKIMYTKMVVIKKGHIPLDAIPAWNEAVGQLSEFYNDQIILIKH
jgi:hypothetical protein